MRGKRYNAARGKVEERCYSVSEALSLITALPRAKFDETVDLSARLGIDSKNPEETVRGAVVLPNGIGKAVKVVAFAKGEKEKEAKDAGADYAGAEKLIEKIQAGWLDFDKIVATPDMMGAVSKLGKILGPRGLMPNPKLGTVTFDLSKAISELKAGRVEYKGDKAGVVHASFGRASFAAEKLKENLMALVESIMKAKPSSSKGTYLKSLYISTTMGPSVAIDTVEVRNIFK